ncbi:MAG TPA: Ig domain-containing protein [Spirochaetia bacterium]|nr:Ig domain-containing protein [Spirochaetia bacterium]
MNGSIPDAVNITLSGANINLPATGSSIAFSIGSGSQVNLSLLGTNTLTGDDYYAGLGVPTGATLDITAASTGSLATTGNNGAAGIGGGTVNINGGTVTASAGSGTLTINGGSVNAKNIQPVVYNSNSVTESLVTVSGLPASASVSYTVNGGNSVSCSTDANGMLYLWLPLSTTVNIDIAANGSYYVATGNIGNAGSNPNLTALLYTISTTSLPPGIIGQPYSASLSAQSGTAPYTWSASGLPAGLTLDSSTGSVSGTPTDTGNFSVAVTVYDMNNEKVSATLTLTVNQTFSIDLTGLSVSQGTLSPGFDKNIVAYQVYTSSNLSSLDVTVQTADPAAGLTIGGQTAESGVGRSVYLNQGANLIPVVVTAPGGDNQKAYILSVNGTVGDDNLGSLSVSTGSLSFNPGTTTYNLGSVDSSVSSLSLTASPDDPKALMLLNGGLLPAGVPTAVNLAYGSNEIAVMVVAQDAATKTYTIDVTRNQATSPPTGGEQYTVTPVSDPSYTIGTAAGGVPTMTVNSGVSGFKYFTVTITPVVSQAGNETAVFVQYRSGEQIAINAINTDFNSVNGAQAGFNVQSGDMVKVFIVDALTNQTGSKPNPL